MLLYNGKIITPEGFREAAYLVQGRITDLGSSQDLLRRYPDPEKYDLGGKLVLPGFNDCHLHLLDWEFHQRTIDLEQASSISEIIARGRDGLTGEGIIVLTNYDDENLERKLTKDDLDRIATNIPVIAYRRCGHIAIINTKALAQLQLTPETQIQGGIIDVDRGILQENALSLLKVLFRPESVGEAKERILRAVQMANAYGLTSLGSNDLKQDVASGRMILQAYRELAAEGRLNARISLQFTAETEDDISSYLEDCPDDPYLRLGPLKLFIDGSLGGRTAYLSEDYRDYPGRGFQLLSASELDSLLEIASRQHLQVMIHAIGDAGINLCLDALAKIPDHRHALVHVQVTDQKTLERFTGSGVNTVVQPIFVSEDLEMARRRLSPRLLKTSYAFRSLYQRTVTAFSSDAPYGGINPLAGISVAVSRRNSEGKKFNLQERLRVAEAVRAYTYNSAYLSFEEERKGLIAPGYAADLVVLERDIFAIPAAEIPATAVLLTIVGGRIVYRKGTF
jgi:predicted amidohydrolase YtcJ